MRWSRGKSYLLQQTPHPSPFGCHLPLKGKANEVPATRGRCFGARVSEDVPLKGKACMCQRAAPFRPCHPERSRNPSEARIKRRKRRLGSRTKRETNTPIERTAGDVGPYGIAKRHRAGRRTTSLRELSRPLRDSDTPHVRHALFARSRLPLEGKLPRSG